MILRVIAFVAGLLLLAATAHVTISNTGGYGQPSSWLTMAIALGVGVGALAIGSAWNHRRKALAAWLLLAIVAGEGFGFVMTAERLVTGREAAQAPLRAAEAARLVAGQRVTAALAAAGRTPTSSPRLAAALQAKATADRAATDKSAERGCRENCRELLQAQVDAAEREVAAAREDLGHLRSAAERDLEEARHALAGLKPTSSATPLADRLGLPPWAIDLLASALGSLAANGLGCGLIAFAVHRRQEASATPDAPAQALQPMQPPQQRLPFPAITAVGEVSKCLIDTLRPAPGERYEVGEFYVVYLQWCRDNGYQPLSRADFDRRFAAIAERAPIRTQGVGARLYALDVKAAT